jgi:HK97 family phage portal protein
LHDKPNDYATAHQFWSTVTSSLLLRGNAYAYKQLDEVTDEVEALWLLDPSTVTVEVSPSTNEKRFVQYTLAGKRRVYSVDEVVHFMGFSLDGIVGCSRIEYCRQTLGNTLGRHRFEAEFYANGTRVPGVIEHPGLLGDAAVTHLADTFKARHTGKGNRHKVPVLEEGATFHGIGMSLEDMQFVQQAQLSHTEVAVLFNLPPAYLGGSTGDSLTYATTESNQIQFAQMAVAPLTNRIAKTLSADPQILPWNVMYAEFVLEALMRADMKTRVEYWEKLLAMNVVSREFVAARESLPAPPAEKPPPPQLLPSLQDATPGAPNGALSLMDAARTNGSSQ